AELKDTERTEAFANLEKKIREHRHNMLIMMLMPASGKVAEAARRSQGLMRCTIAAVAAERYRLKHKNAWPRNLDDLVKDGLLKEVPKDPYDGKPLRFKR